MAVSFATQHRRRVERLVEGVKAYAQAAGVNEKTASRRILNQSWELGRLEEGGMLSPKTLELREAKLKEKTRELRIKAKAEPQAVSA